MMSARRYVASAEVVGKQYEILLVTFSWMRIRVSSPLEFRQTVRLSTTAISVIQDAILNSRIILLPSRPSLRPA